MPRRRRPSQSSPARIGLGFASLALAALLLVGFKAPDSTIAGSVSRGGTGGSTGGSTGTTGGAGSSTGSTTGKTGSTTGSAKSGTFDGTLFNTRYGPVEVEITVSNGKVTAVTALALPSGGRSGAISDYVAPVLSSEALTAQSATIDLVSGATYTSEAYARSLQSALDQAGI